jgi:hypothetical protein
MASDLVGKSGYLRLQSSSAASDEENAVLGNLDAGQKKGPGDGDQPAPTTAYAVRGGKRRYAVLKRLHSQNQPGPNNRAIGLKSPMLWRVRSR